MVEGLSFRGQIDGCFKGSLCCSDRCGFLCQRSMWPFVAKRSDNDEATAQECPTLGDFHPIISVIFFLITFVLLRYRHLSISDTSVLVLCSALRMIVATTFFCCCRFSSLFFSHVNE